MLSLGRLKEGHLEHSRSVVLMPDVVEFEHRKGWGLLE